MIGLVVEDGTARDGSDTASALERTPQRHARLELEIYVEIIYYVKVSSKTKCLEQVVLTDSEAGH